jgi:hypothetical protein
LEAGDAKAVSGLAMVCVDLCLQLVLAGGQGLMVCMNVSEMFQIEALHSIHVTDPYEVVGIEMHNPFKKLDSVHREALQEQLSVDTAQVLDKIVHLYSLEQWKGDPEMETY